MPEETTRSRVRKVMNGQMPDDRLPVIEWAHWWNLTIERWQQQGLPAGLDLLEVKQHLGLDIDCQLWFPEGLPSAEMKQGKHWVENEQDYERLLAYLYPRQIPYDHNAWRRYAEEQASGQIVIWVSLSGFFWWPRVLLGIEPHLYAFYDRPELMHRINEDLVKYHIRCLDDFCANICIPDYMTFAEDMSYNHGPTISKEQYDEFMAPYYRQIVPKLKERGITVLIDSDGDIEPLIPWFQEVGIEGILPLERMAGVDINRIRANHPEWKMIGGFDKTVMHLGEKVLRAEFERLLPAMRSGRYIPSVDHQTPPAVSLEDYRLYLRLLREYCAKAVQ